MVDPGRKLEVTNLVSLTDAEIAEITDLTGPYLRSYAALLWLGELVPDSSNGHALHSLALAAYGWMPTILRQPTLEFPTRLGDTFVNRVRTCPTAKAALGLIGDMDKPLVNNSWVGTSKVLHFLNPQVFPMWDRRVAATQKLGYRAKFETRERYSAHIEYAHARKFDPPVQQIRDAFAVRALPYTPTHIRCVDLVLFHRGKLLLSRAKPRTKSAAS